jgi:hypothetical protein
VVVVGGVVITGVLAWIGGSKVGEEINKATKPNPPAYDPKVDPRTQEAIRELLSRLRVDIHTGLPGGNFPDWCRAHPNLCRGGVAGIGSVFTWLMMKLGGLEGIEDADRRPGK